MPVTLRPVHPDPRAKRVNCSEAVRAASLVRSSPRSPRSISQGGLPMIASKPGCSRAARLWRHRRSQGTRMSSGRNALAPRSFAIRRRAVLRRGRVGSLVPVSGPPTPRTVTAARFSRVRNHAPHHRSQTSFQRSTGASRRVSDASACSLARICSSVSPGSVAMRDLTAIASRSATSCAPSSKSGSAREASRWPAPGACLDMSAAEAPTRLLPVRK